MEICQNIFMHVYLFIFRLLSIILGSGDEVEPSIRTSSIIRPGISNKHVYKQNTYKIDKIFQPCEIIRKKSCELIDLSNLGLPKCEYAHKICY